MKRVIALFLFVTVVICSLIQFSGCSSKDEKDNDASGSDTKKETAEERIYPDIPSKKYDGYTFSFAEFDIDGWGLIFDIEDDSEDSRVASAIYNRNAAVEELLDIDIDVELMDLDRIRRTYEQQIAVGDADFDTYLVRSHEMQFILAQGLPIDLNELPYCDFTKPWWDSNSVEQFSIDGRLFLVESDITLRDKNATAAMFFNKSVQQDRQIGDIYSIVRNNEWTYDKMIQLAKQATFDSNGDTVMDEEDTWGLVADDDLTYMLLHGGGAKYSVKDENDLPISGFDDVRTMEVAQRVVDIIYNDEYFFHLQKRKDTDVQPFTVDRALFFIDALFRAQGFNDMETDFGIIPVPKYNEDQKEYGHSVSIHFSSALSVPKTNPDIEKTSIILEALAAESKYTVIPEYYDVYVKVRNTRDEDAKQMLDIIFATRVYDLGEFFNFGQFNSAYLRIWSNKTTNNVSTLYGSYSTKIKQGIEQFINKVL